MAFPVWVLYFLRTRYEHLQEDSNKKYERVFDGIELDGKLDATWEPFLYCLRRVSIVTACFFARDNSALGIIMLVHT